MGTRARSAQSFDYPRPGSCHIVVALGVIALTAKDGSKQASKHLTLAQLEKPVDFHGTATLDSERPAVAKQAPSSQHSRRVMTSATFF
jgi:hypothetical protein